MTAAQTSVPGTAGSERPALLEVSQLRAGYGPAQVLHGIDL